jgi:hypothetical protein
MKYRSPHPLLSYIKFYRPEDIKKSIIPERRSLKGLMRETRMTSVEKIMSSRLNRFISGTELFELNEYYEDFEDTINNSNSMYHSNGKMLTISSLYFHRLCIPISIEKEDKFKEESNILNILDSKDRDDFLRIHKDIGLQKALRISEIGIDKFNEYLRSKEDEMIIRPNEIFEDPLEENNISEKDYTYEDYFPWISDGRPNCLLRETFKEVEGTLLMLNLESIGDREMDFKLNDDFYAKCKKNTSDFSFRAVWEKNNLGTINSEGIPELFRNDSGSSIGDDEIYNMFDFG